MSEVRTQRSAFLLLGCTWSLAATGQSIFAHEPPTITASKGDRINLRDFAVADIAPRFSTASAKLASPAGRDKCLVILSEVEGSR
jgi:hypothetical protein